VKKSILIELDKPRHLRFDFNSLCDAEDMIGKPISQIQDPGLKETRILLFCGLKWEDRSLTPTRLGNIIDDLIEQSGFSVMEHISQKVDEAFILAYGEEDEKKNLLAVTK
jgi:hypothetical protein